MTTNSYRPRTTTPTANSSDVFANRKKDPKYKVIFGDFYYTRVGKPITQLNTKAEGMIDVDPFFTATLGLTDNSAKYLSDNGFEVSEPTKDIPKPHIKFRRNVKAPDTQVDLFDANGNEMDRDILIGNGSKGQALVFVYDKQNGNKTGALMGIQVTNLIEYKPDAGAKPAYTPKPRAVSSTATPTSSAARKPVSYNKTPADTEMNDDEIPF